MDDFTAPREDLVRMAAGVELRAAADGEGRTLVGYAAMFNRDTVINSWEGQFIERIAPGAFKRTLKNNGAQVKVLFNHGFDPSIGDKPLGRAAVLKEDDKGLYVEVPLSRTSFNEDLIALIDDGAIDGMSFRFSVPDGGDTWAQPTRKGQLPVRTLTEVKLRELGPVTFPAYQATSAGIRSRDTFDAWRSLSDDKRDAIFEILGTSTPPPGDPTGDEEPADRSIPPDSEPPEGHHSPDPLTRSQRLAAAIERGIR